MLSARALLPSRLPAPPRRARALLRAAPLWLGLLASLAAPAFAKDPPPTVVLQSKGELLLKQDGALEATDERGFDPGTVLQAGQLAEGQAPASLPDSPPTAWAVLSLAPGEVVTLSTGASVGREAGADQPAAYTLTGAAHWLVDAGPDHAPRDFTLNGVPLRIAQAHLYFDGWAEPATVTVVQGEARLLSAGGEGEGTAIVPGQRLVLAPEGAHVEGEPTASGTLETPEPLLTWSTVAGFESPGPYKRVGDAIPTDGHLKLNRNETLSEITGKRIPVFEGDQLLSEEGQRVRVEFTSGDKVRLTGKTVFKIDEYLPENQEKPSMLFSLLGKVRSLIVSRFAPDSVRFKTPTATLGVKGTDFNTIGDEAQATVETLDGTVGVTMPDGTGEVLVGPGMQTTVPQGQPPAPPSPIPPARLQELQQDAIAVAAAAAAVPAPPVAAAITIQSPQPGDVLREVTLAYTVDPAEAPVEVLLDDEPVEAEPGATLPTPPDGPHTLIVRGVGEGAPEAAAAFEVDTTPPAPAGEPDLAALTMPAGGTLTLSWNEPVTEASVKIGELTLPLVLAADRLSGTLAPNPEAMKPESTPLTLRLVDRAGNTAEVAGAIAMAPPEPAAPPGTAAEPTAAPRGDPCPALKQAYETTIAGRTGTAQDEVYLNTRGGFACARIATGPGAAEATDSAELKPDRRPGAGIAAPLDEPFLNDLR